MSPGEWIGFGGVVLTGLTTLVTVHLANRSQTNELKRTISSLYLERLDKIEEDDKLRDEWIQEIQNKVQETSGKVQLLDYRVKEIKETCRQNLIFRKLPSEGI